MQEFWMWSINIRIRLPVFKIVFLDWWVTTGKQVVKLFWLGRSLHLFFSQGIFEIQAYILTRDIGKCIIIG